ncbi:MAG TPA: hypothetical protein VIT88_03385 [Pyrinomonadaceae bacterium]
MGRFHKILFAICFALCAASGVHAQIDKWGYWQNGVSEAWWFPTPQFTTQQADEAIARWKSIEDENRATSNAWTGTYFQGSEVHGTYLRLSLRNGFVIAHVDKCQAKVVGLTYGTVEFSPSVIKLFPQFHTANTTHGAAHSHTKTPAEMRFVPVKLNADQLLVDEKEMTSFGNYVAGLGNYNFSDFHYSFSTEFLTHFRETTADQSDEGKESRPMEVIVPDEYIRYLKKPIEATITRVGRVESRKSYSDRNSDGTGTIYNEPVNLTTVVVSAGTAHGLKRGMFLNLIDPKQNERVKILRTGRTSSTGVIVRSLDENGREVPFDYETGQPYSGITLGRKLTTSPF